MECEDCTIPTEILPGESRGAEAMIVLPRVEIKFCTQCRWMLRAAWYAQELLTTFSHAIGEVALVPAAGGTFVITLVCVSSDLVTQSYRASNTAHAMVESERDATEGEIAEGMTQVQLLQSAIIWDRRVDGGFPDVKVLKQKVRNLIDPGKNLGHSDKTPTAAHGSQ